MDSGWPLSSRCMYELTAPQPPPPQSPLPLVSKMDAITNEEVKKKLMLERFQEEVRGWIHVCGVMEGASPLMIVFDTN
jgi:hypothetical protein